MRTRILLVVLVLLVAAGFGFTYHCMNMPPPGKLSYESLSVAPLHALEGSYITVFTHVKNVGGLGVRENVILKLNGEVKEVREVSVAGGESKTLRFILHPTRSGNYTVNVGNLTGSFKIYPADTKMKILNNLVIELLNITVSTSPPYAEYSFFNPRDGWIFISSTADVVGSGGVRLALDSAPAEEALTIHEASKERTLEAMRFLSAGEHKVRVWCEVGSSLENLTVRAIPELIYCKFGYDPHVSEHGPYDWKFLEKDVLKNVNVIIGTESSDNRSLIEEWKKQGKRWIIEVGVPGLREPSQASGAYSYWSQDIGFQDPFDGVIADEFFSGDLEQYLHWTGAVEKIFADKRFGGKVFYAYVAGRMYEAQRSRSFIQTLIDCGYRFAGECYFAERPNEAAARESLLNIKQPMLAWREDQPGVERHMIICFGYLSAPPESLNVNPSVDYKVWMDMQLNMVANDPVFSGVYGIMWYTSGYADEEAVRWAGKLFRHYCIQGKTEMLSRKYGFQYKLTHIENPDFDEGTEGWTLSPAEEGSIQVKNFEGYSWLEGRYPPTDEGNNFLWMKRSSKGPNVFSQEIKNLQPGRLYSLKMFTADYGDLVEGNSNRQRHALNIRIENAEVVAAKSFQHIFANCYSHHLGPFNDQYSFWMNYHQLVFHAKGNTAKLIISDWASEEEPGGPIDQELIYNFIEIQPYLED